MFEFWSVTPYLRKKLTRRVSVQAGGCALVGCNEVADAVGAEDGACDVPVVAVVRRRDHGEDEKHTGRERMIFLRAGEKMQGDGQQPERMGEPAGAPVLASAKLPQNI